MSLVLFGMISANGLKVIVEDKVDLGNIKNIIIISTMLVVGLGGMVIAFTSVVKLETMALAAVIGISLNLLFKLLDKIFPEKEPKEEVNS
jgi:uracil permease